MLRLISLWIVLLSVVRVFDAQAVDLEDLRRNYDQLISNKALCEDRLLSLSESTYQSATHMAYLGALQAIWANHVFNPISKIRTFKLGTQNVDKAIEKEPKNVELRFIRFSIQKNVPSFLGYKSNMKEDMLFLKQNHHQVQSAALLKNIDTLLKEGL